MCGKATVATEVSSTSMKVGSITATAISQGLQVGHQSSSDPRAAASRKKDLRQLDDGGGGGVAGKMPAGCASFDNRGRYAKQTHRISESRGETGRGVFDLRRRLPRPHLPLRAGGRDGQRRARAAARRGPRENIKRLAEAQAPSAP